MKKIIKTPFFSQKIGKLPKGCRLCVKGQKSVFFITGICPRNCFFCPISDEKKNKDVIYINEMKTDKENEIIDEIKACSSKGVGITGGDPAAKIDRTVRYINLLKKEFGKTFHIHIYLTLNLINKKKLDALYQAGLDEIRFHPDLDDNTLWKKIDLASGYNWDIGIEIPVIPGKKKQTIKLIDSIKDKVSFLNLNELELSDTNYNKILEHGYHAKDDISYAIKGSEKLAQELMQYIIDKDYPISVHYCTAKLKDKIQLTNRLKNRAKNTIQPFDEITEVGMLIRGAIYLDSLVPGFDYRKKLSALTPEEKTNITKELNCLRNDLMKRFDIPKNLIKTDLVKLRLLSSIEITAFLSENITNRCAIVKEYPTYDSFEVEIDFLN